MNEIERIAKVLTKGAAKACYRMTEDWQFPGKATFDANGAWALHWAKTGLGKGALAQIQNTQIAPHSRKRRLAFRLTPIGHQVRDYLIAQEKADD